MSRPIRIIDSRNKQYFMVDDLYLNGYARLLGPVASMVYISLCRHSAKDQTSFPSQELIAKEIGAKERTVMQKIKLLKEWNIIESTKMKGNQGRWLNNTYTLLDKSVWKPKPPTVKQQVDTTYSLTAKPPTVKQQLKDTHLEGYTTTIKDEDVEKLTNKILQWAYTRSPNRPSIPADSYKKSVLSAIDRLGAVKVYKMFENEVNAISFLISIKG